MTLAICLFRRQWVQIKLCTEAKRGRAGGFNGEAQVRHAYASPPGGPTSGASPGGKSLRCLGRVGTGRHLCRWHCDGVSWVLIGFDVSTPDLALLVGSPVPRSDMPTSIPWGALAAILGARRRLTRACMLIRGCVYQFAMEALRSARAGVIPRDEAWRSGRGVYHVEARRHSRSIGRADNLESIERCCASLGWRSRLEWMGRARLLRDYRECRFPKLLLR
jgi:hypothetical protein